MQKRGHKREVPYSFYGLKTDIALIVSVAVLFGSENGIRCDTKGPPTDLPAWRKVGLLLPGVVHAASVPLLILDPLLHLLEVLRRVGVRLRAAL